MRLKRTLATLLVALLLVTAGCTSSSNIGGAPDSGAPQGSTGGESGNEEAADAPDGAEGTPAVDDRKLVYTAELRLRVDSFDDARANLTAATRAAGGYVSSTKLRTEEYDNETYTDGTVVLRVPSENYSSFMASVEGEGKVLSVDENVDDVTRQYVDLEARLENLKNERDRLRELYEQANTTEEVLKVEERLSEVQGEIESTEAQLRTLQNQVSYATVTVHLNEERPDRTFEQNRWYDTGVIDAFLESVSGVVVTLRALVVGLAYAAPYLIVFGLPALGVVALIRRLSEGAITLPSLPGRGGGEGGGGENDGPDAVGRGGGNGGEG